MSIALISMRSDYLESRKERRDSIDTQLYKIVKGLGLEPVILGNEPSSAEKILQIIDRRDIKLIILSGGNDLASYKKYGNNIWPKRDQTEDLLWEYGTKENVPMLGICRGFQFITNKLGMKLEKISGHVNRLHYIIGDEDADCFLVNSFHSWGLYEKELIKGIKVLYKSKTDQSIEAYYNERLQKVLCIMWHPERENGAFQKVKEMVHKYLC